MPAKTVKKPFIGIDLGTTKSCVGYWKNGKTEVIPNEYGRRTTSSSVFFSDEEKVMVGDVALKNGYRNPTNTITNAKHLMGVRRLDKERIRHWPFKIVKGKSQPSQLFFQVEHRGKKKAYAPEEISAMVLAKMKHISETSLGGTINEAVISAPASCGVAHRQAIMDAGTLAGFSSIRIISSTIAGALAYGVDKMKGMKDVLVFDLGGGSLDVSLVTIEDGIFEVKATAGDARLGGEKFDDKMVDYFAGEFEKKHRKDLTSNSHAMHRLRAACKRAKRTLSSQDQASIEVDSLLDGIDFFTSITRARFEELNNDLFLRTLEPVKKVLLDTNTPKNRIYDIVLVGGSTRIPKIQSLLQDFFDGKTLYKSLNPDEAVVCGAAIQGAILGGSLSDLLIIDATPYSVGIEVAGGIMTKLIKRNSGIPAVAEQFFSTYADNQKSFSIQLFEGEEEKTKDCYKIGTVVMDGIPPAPKGVPKLKVTLSMDSNGILKVSAVDDNTGREFNYSRQLFEGIKFYAPKIQTTKATPPPPSGPPPKDAQSRGSSKPGPLDLEIPAYKGKKETAKSTSKKPPSKPSPSPAPKDMEIPAFKGKKSQNEIRKSSSSQKKEKPSSKPSSSSPLNLDIPAFQGGKASKEGREGKAPKEGREGRVKCKYGEDIARFSLSEKTTLEEFIKMIENEWGKGLGVKYQDEEGDWLKMRTDEDVVEVWSQTSSKNVSLKVFLREQNESTPSLSQTASGNQKQVREDDVAMEDLNNSVPIRGVWDKPLLSFEEAVKMPKVKGLNHDYILSCLDHFYTVEDPPPGLTIDEACAVRFYTMETPFYGAFNKALRTRDREAAKAYFPFLQLLLLAMHKLPKSKGILFRGTKNLPQNVLDEYIKKAKSKKCVFWGACSSTTTSVATLSNPMFCGKKGSRTKFVIMNCDIGVSVEALSAIGVEKEVLLPPCLKFAVEDYVDLGNGLLEFQLRYSTPRLEMLQLTPPPQFLS